jgi:hypothetical protein
VADEVEQAVEENLVDHEVALHPGLHLSNPAIANTVLFISSERSKKNLFNTEYQEPGF